MPSPDLDLHCQRVGEGWRCEVRVGTDAGATQHRVTVDQAVLDRLAPGSADPVGLVRASFRFLLEREPREAILRSFDLPLIGRYFTDWEAAIRNAPGC